MIRSLLALSLLWPLALPWSTRAPALAADETSALVEEIVKSRDEADPKLIARLAGMRSRAAAEGLIRVYDAMASIYMKREVVRALGQLDGVEEAEQLALQRVLEVATSSEEPELREAALLALGGAKHLGKSFLEMIVESPAEDSVRERAMELHAARAEEADKAWYTQLYEKEKAKDPKRDKKRKQKEDEKAASDLLVHRLASVREIAFDALRESLPDAKLLEACEDSWAGIRALAIDTLARKDPKAALRTAREMVGDLEERSATRAAAARAILRVEGAKAAAELIERADANVTPEALRYAIAEMLAELRDPKVDKAIAKQLAQAKRTHEKLWTLRALRASQEPKLGKSIERLLGDEDVDVRLEAARTLGIRREKESLPALMEVLKKPSDQRLLAEVLGAVGAIRGNDPEWIEQLVGFAKSADPDVRNAALTQLGATGDPRHLDTLVAALSSAQWSTRLAALHGLEKLRSPAGVGAIVARMGEEQGRMLHEFADVLFRLTGQPYRTAAGSWRAWWEQAKSGFQPISEADLQQRQAEEEERRLRQVTNVKFFGIRIVSQRVIFVIDVSGSMTEAMRPRTTSRSTNTTRMDVAKEELAKCIDGLDRNALFNILTFSSGVDPWLPSGITGSTARSREDAKAWIGRLGAMGATNLYDALEAAFRDPDVDTIYVLSDGEPTAGKQVDPGMIRLHVQQWNEHRGIVIHSISIGLQLEVLRWLAEDSGGQYVQFF